MNDRPTDPTEQTNNWSIHKKREHLDNKNYNMNSSYWLYRAIKTHNRYNRRANFTMEMQTDAMWQRHNQFVIETKVYQMKTDWFLSQRDRVWIPAHNLYELAWHRDIELDIDRTQAVIKINYNDDIDHLSIFTEFMQTCFRFGNWMRFRYATRLNQFNTIRSRDWFDSWNFNGFFFCWLFYFSIGYHSPLSISNTIRYLHQSLCEMSWPY